MRMSDLLHDMSLPDGLDANLAVSGLTCDSRKVRPGYVFAAFSGAADDGAAYIEDASAKGACAVLAEAGTPSVLPLLPSAQPRLTYAQMAARFFKYAPQHIVAVTGTNGKTSVAEFYRQIIDRLGLRAASLGTMGVTGAAVSETLQHTTPEPAVLHAVLRDLYFEGVTHLAMEASSHGLSQYRVDGVRPQAAAFTNLTRDHLDYHQTEAAYLEAKSRLFTDVLAEDGMAVINLEGAGAPEILERAERSGKSVLTVGLSETADVWACDIVPGVGGMSMTLHYQGDVCPTELAVIGRFQIENVLCAVGLAMAGGLALADIAAVLPSLSGAAGRLERVGVHPNGAALYVDYAHTPDALRQVLENLHPHCSGRLICVFGCGGDRDAGKRPLMGQVAAQYADFVIITDDNPRSEAAAQIREQIQAASPQALNIGDRSTAIAEAVAQAGAGDIVLVAGKGHETGQIVGETVLPFSDHEVLRRLIREAGNDA
ncbi:MAG: UDP-N-acetylmuramoyl-L-alanyl-D-glutamate--2,6-diaminopimelate ligase [Parvibaculales bacterium]